MTFIVFFVSLTIGVQLARCQGGGPSTFGYDASSACTRPYSRGGRAMHLTNLPCDFRRQNWCTVAGSSYPWHAVRRFVHENQGLMRRMYGDEKHINVLRAEFEKNEVELKYDDAYHQSHDDARRFQYDDDYEYIDEYPEGTVSEEKYESPAFSGRSFNNPSTKRQSKFPKLGEYTRPHFRPTGSSTSTSSTATTAASSVTSTKSTTIKTTITTAIPSTTQAPQTIATTTKKLNESTVPTVTESASTTAKLSIENNETNNVTEIPVITGSSIVRDQNQSINEILTQVDRIDEVAEVSGEDTNNVETLVEEDTTVEIETTGPPFATTIDAVGEIDLVEDSIDDQSFSASEQQEFRPRPEYRPTRRPDTSSMEGQLYQDAAAKDQQEQPMLKLRGVNACPVKEEVVAPFWANNTRGEVLALLNLYPFEQYVHWEKCTHENKQMYCRDGCRCEQQYRLHRLLAYDPNNECRGIFSDWFKFPSCCVCRCYDLPLEFRVTSRSPRAMKQRINVRPPQTRHP